MSNHVDGTFNHGATGPSEQLVCHVAKTIARNTQYHTDCATIYQFPPTMAGPLGTSWSLVTQCIGSMFNTEHITVNSDSGDIVKWLVTNKDHPCSPAVHTWFMNWTSPVQEGLICHVCNTTFDGRYDNKMTPLWGVDATHMKPVCDGCYSGWLRTICTDGAQ